MIFFLILLSASALAEASDKLFPVIEYQGPPQLFDFKKPDKPDAEQRAYRDINAQLFDAGGNVGLLLERINELYYSERQKTFQNKQLIESLERFFKLSHLTEDNRCDEGVLEILEQNDHGTERRAREFWRESSHRPIDEIVRHYFILHANHCRQVYIDRFRMIRAKAESRLELVESLLKKFIYQRLVASFHQSNPELVDEEGRTFKLETIIGALTLVESLNIKSAGLLFYVLNSEMTKNNQSKNNLEKLIINDNGQLDESRLRALLDDHLVNPCKTYVRLFGPKVFDLVEFDLKLFKRFDVNNSLLDFYHGWANYQICRQVTSETTKTIDMLVEFCKKRYRQEFERQ